MGVQSIRGWEAIGPLLPSSTARTPVPAGIQVAERDPETHQVAAAPKVQVRPEPDRGGLPSAVKPVAMRLPKQRSGTRLSVDEATERIVAKILDTTNGVIKQIPPEELLRILAKTREIQGLLFDQNV